MTKTIITITAALAAMAAGVILVVSVLKLGAVVVVGLCSVTTFVLSGLVTLLTVALPLIGIVAVAGCAAQID